jgi:hypothetical protein
MTRLVHSRRVRVLAVLAAGVLAASGAWAYWVAPGTGNAAGHIATLPAPAISSATPGSGTVALSWTTVSSPASGSVSYYVSRDGGPAAGNCASATAPSAQTTCTDAGLAAGTHKYTVTAVYRSWSARSAETSANVAVGAVDHLVLGVASTSPTAGASDNLTITAKDSGGATVTTYTGSKSLTFGGASAIGSRKPAVTNSSGTATAFGIPETISFTNGVATVSSGRNGAMTLYKAETASITVTDGTFSSGSGTTVTVSPSTTTAFTLSTPSPTAGAPVAVALTATDQYGNPTPSYTGSRSLTFEGPSKSPSSKSPSYPSSVTFTSGTGTAGITLYDAQTTTLLAREGFSGPSGTSASFTVAAAAAASLTVATPSSPTAANAFSETITAKDLYGNTASSYEGPKTVAFSGPASSPTGKAPEYPASVTFTAGAGAASIVLYDAGSTTLTATEGSLSGTSSSFTVGGASPASFSLPTPSAQTAGTSFNETITAKDAYGNTAGYSGKQTIAFSGPTSSPGGKAPSYPSSVTFSSGVGTAEKITVYDARTTTLTATQGSVTGSTAAFNVSAAGASVFSLTTIPAQTAGTQFSVTLTALDPYGNVAKYEGSKSIAFTGPKNSPSGEKPAYPGTVSFAAGVGSAQITLYGAGATTLEAAQGAGVEGESNSFNVNAAGTAAFTFGTQGERSAGTPFSETLTATDAYGNQVAGYAGTKTIAFSGAAGSPNGKAPVYPASVSFSGGVGTAKEITLYAAASTTLTASEGAISGTSAAFKVAGASATALSLSTPAPTVGTAFSETLTATDAYGNAASNYSGTKTVAFSGPGNGPNGKAPSYPSTVSFSSTTSSGTATITLYNAATTVLSATQGALTGSTPSFAVSPGAAGSLAFGAIGTHAAGTAFNVTLTATDAGGNAIGDGAKTVTFSGPAESPSGKAPEYPASVTFTGGTGTASVTMYDAGATTLSGELGAAKGTGGSFTVSPLAGTKLAWTSVSGNGSAEGLCLFTCTWSGLGSNKQWKARVSVADLYGNVVSGVGSGHTVTLEKTIAAATLSPATLTIAGSGEATSTAGTTYTSTNGGWTSDTLSAKSSGYTEATATLKR